VLAGHLLSPGQRPTVKLPGFGAGHAWHMTPAPIARTIVAAGRNQVANRLGDGL
jgi:hypothetical protein